MDGLVLDPPFSIRSMTILSRSRVVEVRWVVCRKSVAFSGVESSSLMPLMSSAAYWSAAWEMGLGGQAVRKGVSVVMDESAPRCGGLVL